ncbi:hypothetical protein NQ315_005065 [Exocentrus adspersus]|uniref:ascorbate ferrireductase (transmembrane) n=1 Tax=Exocentrus adspersus TaxID=1586481 RepID=A0AAV8VPS3_9CUCU|nr:hypothetical protein NQ315_005065 [Exocentrus adspersus]
MAIKVDYGKLPINVTRFLLNYVTRFIFAGLFLYSCWIPFQYLTGWFSYHVILCTFGYIPLMAEAIMLFVGDELWSRQMSRKSKYWVHGILISVGTIFIIVGNALVFHYIEPGYHLYTEHGITGLVSMIFLILSLFLGLAATYSNEMKQFLSLRPVWYKLVHNGIGLLGYGIGIVSLCYAYYTKWFMFYNGPESRLVALVLTIAVSLWSINGALVSAYNQIKNLVS